jgi:hypothetical protein
MQGPMTFSRIEYRGQVPPRDGLPHVIHVKVYLRVLSILERHRRTHDLCYTARYVAGPLDILRQCSAAWVDAAG